MTAAGRTRPPPAATGALLVAAVVAADLWLLWLVAPEDLPTAAAPSPAAVAVLVLAALPLLARRRRPVTVLAATTAASLVIPLVGAVSHNLAPLAALWTVAARCPRRVSLLAAAAMLAVVAAVVLVADGGAGLPANALVVAAAWLLGDATRTREAHAAALAVRTGDLLAERERAAELAVAEERTRIARELHDVVAHTITVMVVQAGAARRLVGSDPECARAAARVVADTGRQTLGELRGLLGVLGAADGAAYEPQPGLAGLDDLLARYDATAPRLVLSVEGQPRPLPPGVDLSAYRIVQEALTNAVRHADAGGIEVRLRWATDALVIEVLDDGRGPLAAAAPGRSPGHGIIGMRERAALVGGALETGSRPGGGFRVSATLPLEAA